jgi:3-dehydroquinate synthase
MKEIKLHDYTIVIDEHLTNLKMWLSVQHYQRFYILMDENTHQHCWPILERECPIENYEHIIIKSGEIYKNIETCSQIWTKLLDFRADRNALFINLGGGVIGDMGGFAASCYKRGIDFINIPTTVLAQVDASIGGKLGIDFKNGKNLIGLFKNPKRVHVSTCFHATLGEQQINNGLAEIYKHALIADVHQWSQFRQNSAFFGTDTIDILYHSLLIKQRIVEEDPFEKGIRKALNFGHTIGHAIETYSLENDTNPLLHGEAIVIGMITEAYLSVQNCGLHPQHLTDISTTFSSRYKSYHGLNDSAVPMVWEYMQLDKKNQSLKVLAVLLQDIGQPILDVEITLQDVQDSIQFYNNTIKEWKH